MAETHLQNQLAKKYPKDNLVLQHVLNNGGKTTTQQFGELKLKFKYKIWMVLIKQDMLWQLTDPL